MMVRDSVYGAPHSACSIQPALRQAWQGRREQELGRQTRVEAPKSWGAKGTGVQHGDGTDGGGGRDCDTGLDEASTVHGVPWVRGGDLWLTMVSLRGDVTAAASTG